MTGPHSKRPAPEGAGPTRQENPSMTDHTTTTCASTQAAPVTAEHVADLPNGPAWLALQPADKREMWGRLVRTPELLARIERDLRAAAEADRLAAELHDLSDRLAQDAPAPPVEENAVTLNQLPPIDRPGNGQRCADQQQGPGAPALVDGRGRPQPDAVDLDGYEPAHVETVDGEIVTWRTLADISDEAPRPLLLDMLEPDGPNLAYGAPGVGKGMTSAWLATEAQRRGMRPAIYDAERRPREWARRVSGLGGDRSGIVYLEPPDLGRKYAGRPLWESAEAIGRVIRASGADLLIVDSILPAVGLGEDRLRSDAQVPYLFVQALDALRIPSLSIGHPPKGQPEGDPFGSVGWLGAMRLTWLGTTAEGDGHRIRWRPRKRNERGYIAGCVLTVTYGEDGRPREVLREDDDESTREWLYAALVRGPRSVADLAEEMMEETEKFTGADLDRIKERLGQQLYRMKKDAAVDRFGTTGRGVRWGLRYTEQPQDGRPN